MRDLVCLCSLFLLGCGGADSMSAPAAAKPDDPLPKDLRTRFDGSDWPSFLGPTGDSISTEKGILSPWPKAGPPIVWHRRLGEGWSTYEPRGRQCGATL